MTTAGGDDAAADATGDAAGRGVLVVRGREATVERDRAVNDRLLSVAAAGRPAVRVVRPHRQVAFGRQDTRSDGYGAARRVARERGYPPYERDVGGRAVAYTGTGATLAFLRATPVEDRTAIRLEDRYDRVTRTVGGALADLGADLDRGEPPNSFCPGTHSLQGRGKVVGIAQRVRRDAATTAGIVVVRDRSKVARVLGPVYEALGTAFDPASVGSVGRAGGPDEAGPVAAAVEDALVGDRPVEVVAATALDVDVDVSTDPAGDEQ